MSETHPRIHALERMTHSSISKMDKARTLVCAIVSPIEVHGPHLPLGQDLFEAKAMAERSIRLLADRFEDWHFVILPPCPIAADALPMLGSITFPPRHVIDTIFYLLAPFAKAGFARLMISSFHGGPRHVVACEEAAIRIRKKYKTPVMPIFSAALSRITEGDFFYEAIEDVPGRTIDKGRLKLDQHAAFVETSIALALWPELVEDGWQTLPGLVSKPANGNGGAADSFLFSAQENDPSLRKKISRTFETADALIRAIKHYNTYTYYGYPADSSAGQGARLIDRICGLAADIGDDFIRKGMKAEIHSPLWKFRSLFLSDAAEMISSKLGG